MPAKVTLHVVRRNGAAGLLEFYEHDAILVGRSVECRVRLPADDSQASRHHCLFEVNPPEIFAQDLGSRFGIRVNESKHGGRARGESAEAAARRAHPRVKLNHGDVVLIGGTQFRVDIAAPSHAREEIECGRCHRSMTFDPSNPPKSGSVCRDCHRASSTDTAVADGKDTFPGFEIVHRLGVGGMGIVYLARRTKDGLWVALKHLMARRDVDETTRKRFLRESSIVEQLLHENIVAFDERGSDGTTFYFTMEFCAGGTVSRLMAQNGGTLPLDVAGPIALQSLRGLGYAHEQSVEAYLPDGTAKTVKGVVHRDIKPLNILLTGSPRRWTAKIGDFGLAKCFEAAGLTGCTLTGAGAGGTFEYMAREQVLDFRNVKPASDIWSMGATLYAMLAGKGPRDFGETGRNQIEIILDTRMVPLRQVRPDVPRRICDVIERALQQEPADRWQSAIEFHDALASAL